MNRWLQKLGFVVVFALLAQILAPIGGIWAATARAADPLSVVPICSGLAEHQTDPTGSSPADHGSCCPLCAVAHPVTLPENPAADLLLRSSGAVAWTQPAQVVFVARARGPAQARAPPVSV